MGAFRLALSLFVALSLGSCSDWSDGWAIVQGNAAFQRGEFQKASLSYLSAQGTGASLSRW